MTLTAEQQKKVEQNIRLVRKVINDKIHGPYQLGIYTYDDIFQIGCIGLIKAIDHFDLSYDVKFSMYAVPMITAKITAGIFFMSPMELTPIPMEQTPKIFVSSELILVGSLCPNKAPTTPPMATDRALMIIPTGMHHSPLHK